VTVPSGLVVYRVSPVAYFGEPGAPLARTQDEGALDPCVEGEDAASGVIWPLKCQRTYEMGH
jgi:hypothetical protein